MRNVLKAAICFLLIFTSLFALSSCRDPYLTPGSTSTTYDGITLTVTKIDYSGEDIRLITEWRNDTSYEVVYGVDFTVERYDGEDWINCMSADIAFIEIACVLAPHESNVMSYSLSHVDISREGTYRIKTVGYVHNGDDVTSCTLFATFKVENELTLAGYHKLDYRLDSFLIGELKPYYKAGETVSFKIEKVYDLGLDIYLNGEKLERGAEGDEYWEYSFVMPDAPVRLESRTYDGFTE